MSDTATQTAPDQAPATENGNKPRSVDYELEMYDELPDRPGRQSPIKEAIAKIQASPPPAGKWVCIAKYGNGSAATAAANVLRQKLGHVKEVAGWQFATRRVDNGDRTGLFVSYNPDDMTDEGKASQNKWLADRKAKAVAKAQKTEKAAGKK